MRGIRMLAIIRKEFIQIRRDPPSLVISLAMPVIMLLLFGYAVTTDVNHIPMAVLDQDHSQQSEMLAENLAGTGYLDLVYRVQSTHEIRALLDGGQVRAALIIPPGYARRLHRGETASVQFLVDGSDPLFARTAISTAEMVARVKSQQLSLEAMTAQGQTPPAGPGIDLRTRAWYNPGLESLKFNIPGLIGLVMQNVTIMLTAFALVRERERGTLEQLMVTPVRGAELMTGKLIPYILISFVDVALALGIGTLWFKVPVAGSVPLLLGLTLLFLVFALGLGMFFSTIARTQLQAMQMTMLFILPSVLLSGFVFPRASMPLPIQYLGDMIPLTYFLEILRGIMLKGVGINYLWGDVWPLAGFGAGIIALAAWRFKKRVE
ncbi:ABC transporter permease [Desulfotomaculum copahuensis]|uniref:Transporter n=1 Tax=Desulfotomaculum copahuensis TaxID=1838280 RepID=A0A1B7LKU0_9FIRM|nr:ABC transporter permease [Desulfotomaculum copahuensis]OAT87082.1 transporter [Desulfotomaculum copahuensis]